MTLSLAPIHVATIAYRQSPVRFLECRDQALAFARTRYNLTTSWHYSASIGANRNEAVTAAAHNKAEALVMLDDDMFFGEALIRDLVRPIFTYGSKPSVVAAPAVMRYPPYPICVHIVDGPRPERAEIDELLSKNAFQEVHATGLACASFKKELLLRMLEEYKGQPFRPGVSHGEDYLFCRDAAKVGGKIFVDFSIRSPTLHRDGSAMPGVGHLAEIAASLSDTGGTALEVFHPTARWH
jgi:hypothetical protein